MGRGPQVNGARPLRRDPDSVIPDALGVSAITAVPSHPWFGEYYWLSTLREQGAAAMMVVAE